MNLVKIITLGLILIYSQNSKAQSDDSQIEIEYITETLMNYIEGTSNGELDKLRKAFHPEFNLYSVTKEDSLRIWRGKDYIRNFEEGKKNNRIGKIISIDYEKDAAIAKAEIIIPDWRIFTDYFLLLKYEGTWKIVHKSYTWRPFPSTKGKDDKPTSNETTIEKRLVETDIKEVGGWLEESRKNVNFKLNESTLNAFGYRLLYDLNKPQDALKVFQILVEEYPDSPNAYDSMAEGLRVNENFDKSIEYYRKSIELNGRVLFHQLGYLPPNQYNPTVIPNDTTQLFQVEGNWEKEIAFVYVQGGPDLQLNIGRWDGLHLMSNHDNILKVYPLQAQMLNPKSLVCEPMLTIEQSAYENAQSVEILDRVINYLVARKKKVYLIGHSYGASISMEYVHSKENMADKVVLMGLDLDEDISSWKTLKSGEYIRWQDGKTPYIKTVFEEIADNHPLKTSFNRVADNLGMIVQNNMAKEYTKLFEEKDFIKLISVYSSQDEANGIKSQKEIGTLKKQETKIVKILGDHHDMLTTQFMTDLYEYLINGKALKEEY